MGGVSELGAAFPCDRCRLSPRLLRAIPPIGAAFLIDSAKVRKKEGPVTSFLSLPGTFVPLLVLLIIPA